MPSSAKGKRGVSVTSTGDVLATRDAFDTVERRLRAAAAAGDAQARVDLARFYLRHARRLIKAGLQAVPAAPSLHEAAERIEACLKELKR